MKTHTTFRIIITCSLLLSVMVFESKSQQLHEMQPLALQDFECLQSLDCAQKSTSLAEKGWAFVFDETVDELTPELTATMRSDHVRFNAKYDRQGHLIRARYKLKNVSLPKCMLKHLAQDQYVQWQIADSELIIKDFDPSSARYKVKLKNDMSERYEEFDYEEIHGFHNSYDGKSDFCLLN